MYIYKYHTLILSQKIKIKFKYNNDTHTLTTIVFQLTAITLKRIITIKKTKIIKIKLYHRT